jgi:hypothetical protein
MLLAALAAAAIAAPALAQPYGGRPAYGPPGDDRPGGWNIDQRFQRARDRVARGRDDGSLSEGEFYRVERALNGLRAVERRDRYRNGGRLDDRTRAYLNERLDRLSDQIRWLRERDDHRPW